MENTECSRAVKEKKGEETGGDRKPMSSAQLCLEKKRWEKDAEVEVRRPELQRQQSGDRCGG